VIFFYISGSDVHQSLLRLSFHNHHFNVVLISLFLHYFILLNFFIHLVGFMLFIFLVFGLSYYVYLCSVRLYLQLLVRRLMSYLRYLCLFTYSDVQLILCCVFVSFFFVLCTLCCQFLYCPFLLILPLRYSLTFI